MAVVSDTVGGCMLGIENESVVNCDGSYLADQVEHMFGAVPNTVDCQIYVARRSTVP
jgi:hypothetical protein